MPYTVRAGQHYGRLTTLTSATHKRDMVPCRCACGQHTQVIAYALRTGNTRSCGCLQTPRQGHALLHPNDDIPAPLTLREHEILQRCANGHTNHQIGVALGLAEDTIKTHMRRIRETLGARTRAHAVTLAYQHGLLNQPAASETTPRRNQEAAS